MSFDIFKAYATDENLENNGTNFPLIGARQPAGRALGQPQVPARRSPRPSSCAASNWIPVTTPLPLCRTRS